jgi:hypothetical protein
MVPRTEVRGVFSRGAPGFGPMDLGLNASHDPLGDLILD